MKLPLGFHHWGSCGVYAFAVCWQGQSDWPMRTQGWGQHTASASSHLAALHNPHRFWTGPALFIPLPHTQLCNSFSARSRRTSHGPRADCSFRLAIFELTRSTAFQPQEERRTASVLPFSTEARGARIRLSGMTFWERVEHFAESNTCNECVTWTQRSTWFWRTRLFSFSSFVSQIINILYKILALCLLKTLTSTNLLLIFRHPLSVPLLKLYVFFKWCYLFLLSREFLKDSVGMLKLR